MKLFTSVLILVVLSLTNLFGQAGSVELRDGAGSLVNTFPSITEAYNAIPSAITQSYLIEILPAYAGTNEIFPILLTLKSGASAENTITIRPASGNSGEAITTSLSNNSTLIFDGCEYVTIDGRPGGTGTVPDMVIENSLASGTSTYTIHFRNAASFNTLKYCITKNYTQASAGPRNIFFGLSPSNPNGNSHNIIEYCTISGGRSTIGLSGTTGNLNMGNIIRNCSLLDFGYAGIWLLGTSGGTIIENNLFQMTTGYNSSIISGISAAASGLAGETKIIGNKFIDIQMTSTSTTASVKGITITPAAGCSVSVINNFISMPLNNGNASSVYGIHVLGTNDATINIYNNSVYMAGTHNSGTAGEVTSAGILKTNTGANTVFRMKNNIMVNFRSGGTAGAYHVSGAVWSTTGTNEVDYNVDYSMGGTDSYHTGWNSVVYNDISLYKTAAAPNEQNTIFKNIHFVSPSDLHLADSSIGDIDLSGLPLTEVPVDIDGQPRSLTIPYRGADEADTPIPVEFLNLSANVNGTSVIIKWSTATETNNFGFEIERSHDGSWIKIGFVKGSGSSTEIKKYSFSDQNVSAGTYSYRIKQIDMNGAENYYSIPDNIVIAVPVVFELTQNYPNPFNPVTSIRYSIPEPSKVTLKVFTILGSEASVLVNENKEPGQYTVEFNSGNLSSGIYFYTLEAGKFKETRKMIILK